MHDHNKGGGGKGMMWMMIPCLLLLGVLFLGGGRLSGGEYLWPILIGVFVVAHVWMMLRGRRKHEERGDTSTGEKIDVISAKQLEANDKHKEQKHGGCCH